MWYVYVSVCVSACVRSGCECYRHNNRMGKVLLCGHTHVTDMLRRNLLYIRDEIKETVITTQQTSPQTITQTLQSGLQKISKEIPTMNTIRRYIKIHK